MDSNNGLPKLFRSLHVSILPHKDDDNNNTSLELSNYILWSANLISSSRNVKESADSEKYPHSQISSNNLPLTRSIRH